MLFLPLASKNYVLSARLWVKVTVDMEGKAGTLLGWKIGKDFSLYRFSYRYGQRDLFTSLMV